MKINIKKIAKNIKVATLRIAESRVLGSINL